MKLKSLIKKFAYEELLSECERKGWELPTLAEVKDANVFEHTVFWIKPETKVYDERLSTIYDTKFNRVELANKNFMFNVVVKVLPKCCPNCGCEV